MKLIRKSPFLFLVFLMVLTNLACALAAAPTPEEQATMMAPENALNSLETQETEAASPQPTRPAGCEVFLIPEFNTDFSTNNSGLYEVFLPNSNSLKTSNEEGKQIISIYPMEYPHVYVFVKTNTPVDVTMDSNGWTLILPEGSEISEERGGYQVFLAGCTENNSVKYGPGVLNTPTPEVKTLRTPLYHGEYNVVNNEEGTFLELEFSDPDEYKAWQEFAAAHYLEYGSSETSSDGVFQSGTISLQFPAGAEIIKNEEDQFDITYRK